MRLSQAKIVSAYTQPVRSEIIVQVVVHQKTATPLLHDESGPEVEHLKRVLARQRAKDLSEHAKSMLAKDKEIEDLRRKCQELADLLSNDFMAPQVILCILASIYVLRHMLF